MLQQVDIRERNVITMGDEMLAGVCELAFDVAKEGSAPSAMKNYLYLAQRPPRAYSVAQRALEEDARFRERVAERATIENVGEAGYLWLNRPSGWEQRFSDLRAGVEPVDGSTDSETPLTQRPPMPTPPDAAAPSADTPPAPEPTTVPPVTSPRTATPAAPAAPAGSAPTGPAPTVSSIEDELSSLRGLVDRLADERQNVRSSVSELEVELETRRQENLEMSTKLSALRSELSTVQSTESTILLERDRALARITELEADVDRLSAEVERLAADAEGSSSEHQAALTDLALVTSERDSLRSERETAQSALAATTVERDDVLAERDTLRGELDAVSTDRTALTSELSDVRGERDRLSNQLTSTTNDLEDVRAQLATAEAKLQDLESQLSALDQLQADNTELAARLSVAEQARVDLEGELEDVSQKWQTSTRQLSVFENVSSQLDTAVAERDALEAKLVQANDALATLQRKVGTSHEHIRNELADVEAAFGVPAAPAEAATATPAAADFEAIADLEADAEIATDTNPLVDVDPSEVAAGFDTPELETVGDIDVPSFDDPDGGDASDVFDGAGIELDPTMLGGRTIGDMFGDAGDPADDVSTDDTDSSTGDQASASTNNDAHDGAGVNGSVADLESTGVTPQDLHDASTADAVADAADAADAADEEAADEAESFAIPAFDAPSFEAPAFDTPAFEAPAFEGVVADEVSLGAEGDDVADDAAANEAPASAGRRRLSIASDNESAFARQVVESNDVVLLIDGDGAAGLGWPHLDVATRRNALVDYLGTLTADSGAAADVVFSRPVGGEDALPVSRAVRVRIADEAVADSSIFASIVNGYPEEWPIAIVTNESNLIDQADELAVTVMNNDQLLDLFLDLNADES